MQHNDHSETPNVFLKEFIKHFILRNPSDLFNFLLKCSYCEGEISPNTHQANNNPSVLQMLGIQSPAMS